MITAVIGLPGSGKTIFMTAAALKYLLNGFNGFSNYNICLPNDPSKPLTRHIVSRQDLDRARHGYLFLDELPAWLDSRFSLSDQNSFVNSVLQKNRKRNLSLMWSAQSYGMGDLRLRLNTDYVVLPEMYYTEDGTANGDPVEVQQDFFNPKNMDDYLPLARIRAPLIPAWIYEHSSGIIDDDIIRWFDFRVQPVAACYDTTEEIKGLLTSDEKKGELLEEKIRVALEEFYNVPVIRNPNSGRNMNSKDIELTVDGQLMIIDGNGIQKNMGKKGSKKRKNGKYTYYLAVSKKLPLSQYRELEKNRGCKTYFAYEFPIDSGIFYIHPTEPFWKYGSGTIAMKKLEEKQIRIN